MNKTLDYSPISCKYRITVLECFASIKHMQTFLVLITSKMKFPNLKLVLVMTLAKTLVWGPDLFSGEKGEKSENSCSISVCSECPLVRRLKK